MGGRSYILPYPQATLREYNNQRQKWSTTIRTNGGRLHDGGRIWYRGDTMPDSRPEEFDEDTNSVFLDLSASSPRSAEDAHFTYCRDDMTASTNNWVSHGKLQKISLLQTRSRSLVSFGTYPTGQYQFPAKKKTKYLGAIAQWQSHQTHTLDEVQKLYGKLLHACLVVPAGRAYLTTLESMLGIFHNHPFMPRTPPRTLLMIYSGGQTPSTNMNYVG